MATSFLAAAGTDGEAAMHVYPRILFLVWMLAVLIGVALSAPQAPGTPVAVHATAEKSG